MNSKRGGRGGGIFGRKKNQGGKPAAPQPQNQDGMKATTHVGFRTQLAPVAPPSDPPKDGKKNEGEKK